MLVPIHLSAGRMSCVARRVGISSSDIVWTIAKGTRPHHSLECTIESIDHMYDVDTSGVEEHRVAVAFLRSNPRTIVSTATLLWGNAVEHVGYSDTLDAVAKTHLGQHRTRQDLRILTNVVTEPSFRRLGIATNLVRFLVDPDPSVMAPFVAYNPAARALFHSMNIRTIELPIPATSWMFLVP